MVRKTALPLLVLAALLLASNPVQAHSPPPSLVRETGPLYPVEEGFTSRPRGSESTCLELSDGSGPAEASFARVLANRTYHPAGHAFTVLVDLASSDGSGQASSGTGFRIEGELAFGNGTTIEATRSYGSNVEVDATHLDLELDESQLRAGEGPFELTLRLVPTGSGVQAAQDVAVVCNTGGTRVAGFSWALGPVGAEDRDGDGIPDAWAQGAEGEGRQGLVRALNPITIGGFGILAAATAFGAGMLPLAGKGISARRLHLLLGLSAGLLLTVAFAKMIPRAMSASPNAGWIIVGVFLTLLVVEWALGGHGHDHSHGADQDHGEGDPGLGRGRGTQVALIALVAMSLHRFVGGLSMPAAFGLDQATGVAVVGALMAHQIPDGLAAASLFLAGGWGRKRVIRSVAGVALWVPVGAIAGLVFINVAGLLVPFLALSAGTFLYIATVELIPELSNSDHRGAVAGGFVVGIVLAWGLVVELTKLV